MGDQKFRFCVNFRALNSVTTFDTYPLPISEETTATLCGFKYFTVLDCYNLFWQISIRDHMERTGFSVPCGNFELKKLPFGLSNSPASFQELKDEVFKNPEDSMLGLQIYDCIFQVSTGTHSANVKCVAEFDYVNL